jgi:putative hydrolase of the HAD superfamily
VTAAGTVASRTSTYRCLRILEWMLRAVLFDVDFTLFRPGPLLGPEGYRQIGAGFGLSLDPARYEDARLAAVEEVQHHPELRHDEEVWIAFTEQIMVGMGGEPGRCRDSAVAMVREWERHDNFSLYDDALPVLEQVRRFGLRIGLISNGQRDLAEFAVHHRLDVDVTVGSLTHGRIKPHPSIFETALVALEIEPDQAVMVGDSYEDDIRGARALGMRAILVDRDGIHPQEPDRIDTLFALPAALGLEAA